MVEQLFGSKTRVKLLQLFMSNPNRSFYVREITRKIDEQINSVRRELANLLSIGIITSDNTNNKLYYEVNQKYQFYKPLSEMFGTGVGLTKVTSEEGVTDIEHVGHVMLALLTGQFTRDESTGVDVLVVGDVNQAKMAGYVASLEEKEGKAIRYAVITPDEFDYRQQVKDRFISQVMQAKKQVLVDANHIFSELEEELEVV